MVTFHHKCVCDLFLGGQSTAAGGGEPWGSSPSGGGGLPWRYAVGEDPECPGWHCPVATPHPQRCPESAFSSRILTHISLFIFTLQPQTLKYAECICKRIVKYHTASETSLCHLVTMVDIVLCVDHFADTEFVKFSPWRFSMVWTTVVWLCECSSCFLFVCFVLCVCYILNKSVFVDAYE